MKAQFLSALRDRTLRASRSTPRFRASRKLMITMLIGLSGGAMFATTCQSRFRDAAVSASKDFVLSLFDPQTILASLMSNAPASGGG